jgi:hypothetical protein
LTVVLCSLGIATSAIAQVSQTYRYDAHGRLTGRALRVSGDIASIGGDPTPFGSTCAVIVSSPTDRKGNLTALSAFVFFQYRRHKKSSMEPERIELVNGLTTRVLDTGGDKPTLVLIHGLANAIEIWSRVLTRLARRFRVLAFDLPGFGEANRPVAAYDAAFFVDQLKALLDTLAIERAHLVGSSLGAGVIVRFSGQNLDRIDRAVLAAPGGFGRETHPLMRVPGLAACRRLAGPADPRQQ